MDQLNEEVTDITLEDKPKEPESSIVSVAILINNVHVITIVFNQGNQLVGVVVDDDSDDDEPILDMDEYEEEDDPVCQTTTCTCIIMYIHVHCM